MVSSGMITSIRLTRTLEDSPQRITLVNIFNPMDCQINDFIAICYKFMRLEHKSQPTD